MLTHRGEALTAQNIGGKLATRDLMADLRGGLEGQGPRWPAPPSPGPTAAPLRRRWTASRGDWPLDARGAMG